MKRQKSIGILDDIPLTEIYALVAEIINEPARPAEALAALCLLLNRSDAGMRDVIMEKIIELCYLHSAAAARHVASYARAVDKEFNLRRNRQ